MLGLHRGRLARLNVSFCARPICHFLHGSESAECRVSAASNSASDVPNTFLAQAWHVLSRLAEPADGCAGAILSGGVAVSGVIAVVVSAAACASRDRADPGPL